MHEGMGSALMALEVEEIGCVLDWVEGGAVGGKLVGQVGKWR